MRKRTRYGFFLEFARAEIARAVFSSPQRRPSRGAGFTITTVETGYACRRFSVFLLELERIAVACTGACTGRLAGSVPRAVASVLQVKLRSLPLAVLIRTGISVCRTLICNPLYMSGAPRSGFRKAPTGSVPRAVASGAFANG